VWQKSTESSAEKAEKFLDELYRTSVDEDQLELFRTPPKRNWIIPALALALIIFMTGASLAEPVVADLTACETPEAMTYYTEEAYWKNRDRNTVRAETNGACIYDTMMIEFGTSISKKWRKGTTYEVVEIHVQGMSKYGEINPPKKMFAMKFYKHADKEV